MYTPADDDNKWMNPRATRTYLLVCLSFKYRVAKVFRLHGSVMRPNKLYGAPPHPGVHEQGVCTVSLVTPLTRQIFTRRDVRVANKIDHDTLSTTFRGGNLCCCMLAMR